MPSQANLAQPTSELPHPDWLRQPGAVFVTLTQHGELRGCIGSLEAHRTLFADVQSNARAAAFKDPRFPPLTEIGTRRTRIEVSLLSAAEPMQFHREADALAQLRPGIDGVILERGWHRATFLPQVWEQLPEPRQFISATETQSRSGRRFLVGDLQLSRYQVEKFEEDRADHDPP
jgi:uncharacterized protein